MRKDKSKQRNLHLQKNHQLMIEQSLLQKQLFQMKQLKERTYEDLLAIQTKSKKYQEMMNDYEAKNIQISIELQQMQYQQQKMLKDNEALQRQLQYLDNSLQSNTEGLDAIRKKYLIINNQIILDQQGSQDIHVIKKCKFFPSTAQNTYRKFGIQEYQNGFLVQKTSKQIGFTKISNQIAFPSDGIFESIFQIKQIMRNQIILGIVSKDSPYETSQSDSLLYFNFRNQSIQYNGVQIKSFQCELSQGLQIQLIIDMKDKKITVLIHNYFKEIIDFSTFEIAQQSLYSFIALSNEETILYFQNS